MTCTTQELNGSEAHRLDHNPSMEKCPMSNMGTEENRIPYCGAVAQAVGYPPAPSKILSRVISGASSLPLWTIL